jgi:homoserine dehydrogenase
MSTEAPRRSRVLVNGPMDGRAKRGRALSPRTPPSGSQRVHAEESHGSSDLLPLRVGVLGAGTVGREVIAALLESPERLRTAAGRSVELVGVAVRDVDKAIEAGIAPGLVTDAPAHLVAGSAIDVIVELMGGEEPARTLISAALSVGKPVVTANKHVLAHHGPELEAIARRTGAALRFEAAVGGGIPILGPLAADLATNEVSRIRGIVNGTTNVILSAMTDEGRAYDEALAAAQAMGYAEADPSGDVEGADAVNKLIILIRLAFGAWADPHSIETRPATLRGGKGQPGITGVTPEVVRVAAALGLRIKLVADARRSTTHDGPAASVLPTALPIADPLSRINGAMNRIEVRATPVGALAFSGRGAGGPSTSSAILGDVAAIGRGASSTWAALPPALAADADWINGPPETAPDRGWLAIVPSDAIRGDAQEAIDRAAGSGLRVEHVGGHLGVHQRHGSIEAFRAALMAMLAEGAATDFTIYPVDEAESHR